MKNNLLKQYIKNVKIHPKISKATEKQLLQNRKNKCSKVLVESNLRLVIKVASDYHKTWPDFEIMDLIQEGNIGLINGVENFDGTKGIKLSTYLYYMIKAYIYNSIQFNTTPVKIPKSDSNKKIFNNLNKEKKYLESKGLKFDSDSIANNLNVNKYDVIDMNNLLTPGSIKTVQSQMHNLIDKTNPEKELIKRSREIMINQTILQFKDTLKPDYKLIFDKRIMSETPKTLEELAKITGTTKVNIIKKETIIHRKAREFFHQDEIKELFNDY